MFQNLFRYSRIYVTGPQRSGTTICAQMIAADTDYRYVDENDYAIYDLDKFNALKKETGVVIHCPAHCHHIEEYADGATLIVLMRRPVLEILASQERIDWGYEAAELRQYHAEEAGLPIAIVKYARWDRMQRRLIPHWQEISYRDLSAHRMWVPDELRKGFERRQTALPQGLRKFDQETKDG